jgi:hypothetical protein
MKKIHLILGVCFISATSAFSAEVNGINFLDSLVTKPNDHTFFDSLTINRKPAGGLQKGIDAVKAVINKPIIFHQGKSMITYRFPDTLHAIVKVDDKVLRANIMEDSTSRKICFDYRGKAPSYCSAVEYSPGKFSFRYDETHALDAMVIEGIGQ